MLLLLLFFPQLPVPPTCDCVRDRPTCDCAGSLKTSILRPSPAVCPCISWWANRASEYNFKYCWYVFYCFRTGFVSNTLKNYVFHRLSACTKWLFRWFYKVFAKFIMMSQMLQKQRKPYKTNELINLYRPQTDEQSIVFFNIAYKTNARTTKMMLCSPAAYSAFRYWISGNWKASVARSWGGGYRHWRILTSFAQALI